MDHHYEDPCGWTDCQILVNNSTICSWILYCNYSKRKAIQYTEILLAFYFIKVKSLKNLLVPFPNIEQQQAMETWIATTKKIISYKKLIKLFIHIFPALNLQNISNLFLSITLYVQLKCKSGNVRFSHMHS
jgi:hypothetical protein